MVIREIYRHYYERDRRFVFYGNRMRELFGSPLGLSLFLFAKFTTPIMEGKTLTAILIIFKVGLKCLWCLDPLERKDLLKDTYSNI